MNYTIRLFARPRPRPHAPLYQAAVFAQGCPVATSHAFEAAAGAGLAAAIREAQAIRDRLLVEDWTRRVQEAAAVRPDDFRVIDTEGFTSDTQGPAERRSLSTTAKEYLVIYTVAVMITIITAVTWNM